MGLHGIIEFGNRTLTGVVGLAALVVLVLVLKVRHERRDLFMLAATVVLGVAAQALVGGVTVLTGLNPYVVGFHYLTSMTLVCLCAAFLVRLKAPGGTVPGVPTPSWFRRGMSVLVVTTVVTVVLGVLTTRAGPHSGDPLAGRNGFDATVLQHVHAWPSYALVILTATLGTVAWVRRMPVRTRFAGMVILQVMQVLLGIYQARNGLPLPAVGAHMVLASLLAASVTVASLAVFPRHVENS